MAEENIESLEILIRHEQAAKRLYEAYASRFPLRERFWKEIAEDEQRHSTWLEHVRSDEGLKKWFLSARKFKVEAVKSSIGYVENQIARARKGEVSAVESLSISKDLEYALLENHFCHMDPSTPGPIRSVLGDIAAETEGHRRKIAQELAVEKNRIPTRREKRV